MNIKGLKNVDYAGFALRHCEKAAIVVVTCLFVLFLLAGVKKASSAAKISPEELTSLADDLNRRVAASEWNEGVSKENGFEDLNFRDQIKTLVDGTDSQSFQWKQRFFHFLDYGGVLRQQPEVLVPTDLLAYADRAAVSMYVWNDRKNALDEETIEIVAKKDEGGDDEKDETKKKKAIRKKESASKAQMPPGAAGGRGGRGGRNMAESGGGGMPGGMGMGAGAGMGMGEMGGRESGGGGTGMAMGSRGGGGRGYGPGGDEGMGGGMESEESMRGSSAKKGGTVRRSSNQTRQQKRFGEVKGGPGETDELGKDGKGPIKRTVPKEQVRGIRWAMVTAIYPHGEQVAKFVEALHSREDHPQYLRLKVQRRELNSDGSFTEWKDYDWARADKDALRLLPAQLDEKRRMKEDPDMVSAGAIFQGLVMPMPELEAGEWAFFDREVAYDAAIAVAATRAAGSEGEGDGSEMSDQEQQEQGNSFAFGGGAGMPGSAGASGLGGGGGIGMSGMGRGGPGGGMGGGMPGMGRGGPGGGMGGGMPGMGSGAGGGMGSEPRGGAGAPAGGGAGKSASGKSKTKEKRAVQKCAAKSVQIRFIDYTVQPEHTYQYRLKVVVENPNGPLAYPTSGRLDVAEETFAKEPTLESKDWSAPSTPVFVPPDTQYFVLERIKTRPEAKLQVHRWWAELADWQMAEFTIKPGDPIGNPKQQDYVDWENRKLKRDFDFATHDLLLDVTGGDKRFSFQLDGENSERSFNENMPCRVFVVDRLGDLASRNEDIDKHDGIRVEREDYLHELLAGAERLDKKTAAAEKKAAEKGGSEDFDDAVPKRKDN